MPPFLPILVASLAVHLAPPAPAPLGAGAAPLQAQDPAAEYEKRRAAAEGDKQKLWELEKWCEENALDKEKRSTLRAILKLDKDDAEAHKLLGEVLFEGHWYTEKELETHKKKLELDRQKEEEKAAKAKGLVRFGDAWVPPDDVPFLQRGMRRDEKGNWVDPEEVEKLQAGWVRQDLEWVSPEEKGN